MSGPKSRFATQVEDEVLHDVRVTVLALQRLLGPSMTLSQFVTDALRDAVEAAQEKHNDGKPFEASGLATLPPGRRIGGGEEL